MDYSKRGRVGVSVGLALLTSNVPGLDAGGRTGDSAAEVNAVSAGWPSRSATTAAQSVRTGARLKAKPGTIGNTRRGGNNRRLAKPDAAAGLPVLQEEEEEEEDAAPDGIGGATG